MKSEDKTEPPLLLTPWEAAKRTGVTYKTLRKWADKGLIRVRRTLGGHRRYLAADIDRVTQANYEQ